MPNVVHIGFPKAASSYLQKSVFPGHPQIHYVPQEKIITALRRITSWDDTIYNPTEMNELLEVQFDPEKQIQLISHEPFTGEALKYHFINRTLMANRLKGLRFDKVIITIRNQTDILDSSYKQYIKSGGVAKLSAFYGFSASDSKGIMALEYFNYDTIIELYFKLFGRENVFIMLYEQLFTEQEYCLKQLTDFLELEQSFSILDAVPVNQSISASSTKILRILNHFSYSSHRPSQLFSKRISTGLFHKLLKSKVDPFVSSKKSLFSKQEKTLIKQQFAASNRRLSDNYNIELTKEYF